MMSKPIGIALAATLLMTAVAPATVEFYISPNGDDRHPGTSDQPFATIERARNAVRSTRSLRDESVTIWLRGGTYFLQRAVTFGSADSGSKDHPVTYSARPGETAVISGGQVIKTAWTPYRDGIYQCRLEDPLADEPVNQLFINGTRRSRPRLPCEGLYAMVGEDELPRQFTFQPGDIRNDWANPDDIDVVIHQHWTESRMRIAGIDQAAHTVTLTGDTWRPASWSKGYYLENVFEAIGQPGQWYFDRKTRTLYYKPLPDEDIQTVEVVIPVVNEWFQIIGDASSVSYVEHIIFRGLTFHYAKWTLDPGGYSYPQAAVPWLEPTVDDGENPTTPQAKVPVPAAITMKNARHICFVSNIFAHTGAWAIHVGPGCRDNHIIANLFDDLGAGAIRVGEPTLGIEQSVQTGGILISDNRILSGCAVYLAAPAVWIGQSGSNIISHNEITGDFQWAISVGWNWNNKPNPARDNIVEFNHCHHLGAGVMGSHAVIYTLGLSPGTVIRNNLIHDVAGDTFGIALDEGSAGILVENNIIHHVPRGLHLNRGCVCNIIQNNIFAMTDIAVLVRYADRPTPDTINTNISCRNIYVWKQGQLFYDRYPWPDNRTIRDYNVYYHAGGKTIRFLDESFEQWKSRRLDVHSIIADPMFTNVEQGDFRLNLNSPSLTLGFIPISMSDVGPRPTKGSSP